MFDANASHINIGEKFFVEVHDTSRQLEVHGISVGDILLCEHVSKSGKRGRTNDHSILWLDKDTSIGFFHKDEEGSYSWLVYSGRPSGSGFINEAWKNKALDFLGGKWDE